MDKSGNDTGNFFFVFKDISIDHGGHVVQLFQTFKLEEGLCESHSLKMLGGWVRSSTDCVVGAIDGPGYTSWAWVVPERRGTEVGHARGATRHSSGLEWDWSGGWLVGARVTKSGSYSKSSASSSSISD